MAENFIEFFVIFCSLLKLLFNIIRIAVLIVVVVINKGPEF
jgi:hypothetical protein